MELFQQRIYTIEDGLPQNSIFSITQTPDGYIWLATNAGLARFDGMEFDVFTREIIPDLTDDIIATLLVDRDGGLWIATFQGGVMLYKDGGFKKSFTSKDGLSGNNIRAIIQSQDGSLWIGTVSGLNRLENNKISPVPLPETANSHNIQALAEDPGKQLWVGTTAGLLKVIPKDKNFEINHVGLADYKITALVYDGKKYLWVGTNGKGLIRMDENETHSFTTRNGLSSNLVSALYQDPDGTLWIGTQDGGINQLKNHRISVYNIEKGLSHNYIESVFRDNEGNLWIGTNGGGVNLLRDAKVTVYSTQNGLSDEQVYGVYQDSRGNIWVGTLGFGINLIKNGKVIRHYTTKDGLPSNYVITICEDSAGNMWFGTYGQGAVQMNVKTGQLKTYTTRDGLVSDFVYGLFLDRSGQLWVGTNKGGLHRFSNGQFTLFTKLNDKVKAFLEDSRGNLWVGTDVVGLARVTNEKIKIFDRSHGLSSQDIMSIFEDNSGTIWVSTYGGGLNRYRAGEEEFESITREQGLPHDIIYWILEDNNHHLWMSSMAGIFRVSRGELEKFFSGVSGSVVCTLFDEADGMEVKECNGGTHSSGIRTPDGRLWFITARGVAVIDPTDIHRNIPPPPVTIKKIIVDGKEFDPRFDLVALPGKGNIEIRYAGLNFGVPERVRFKYKLQGYDEEWNDPGARREAYYTNISPGTYHFRVKACNQEGTWNEKGASLKITIQPHFWKTWWFRVLGLLFILFMVRLFYILKMRNIKNRQLELEHQVAERTRILKNKTLELEKINNIVKSINAEVDPKGILVSILKKTTILEGIERAGALVYDRSREAYTFKAVVGYEIGKLAHLYFSWQEAEDRYIKGAREIIKDIFIVKDIAGRPGEEKVKPAGIPRSMLILKIQGENIRDAPAGYLIFEDMENENTFDHQDIELLKNLKDHIASAFIKSKLLLELESEREAAEEANQAKSMFLARMSHEIRTPMNSVIGFADMMMNTPLNDEQKEFASSITKSGEALLHLIDDILDFSKIEAGQLTFQHLDFDLEVTTFDVCRLMQPRLGGKPVEILCRIGDNIPAFVKSDPGRIRQVLVNLMGNAVKFTNEGEIELSMTVAEETPDQLKLHTMVRDTGIGIPAEQMNRIFEIFQQADGSITRRYGGTGLGLTISRQIALLMKGDIWAESQPGQGSTFHFTAWLDKSDKKASPTFSLQGLDHKKVLLVDDNLNNLDILFHIVQQAHMQAVKLSDGKEVLSVLQGALQNNNPFDLCVLDIQLGDISGCDVARQIRSHPNPRLANMPLLGFSSSAAKQAKIYRKAGFDGFLPRPIQKNKLLTMMKRLLGGERDTMTNKNEKVKRDTEDVVTRHSLLEEAKHAVHILLAEDNPLNQKLARFMLTKGGYQLEVVNNGKEAVDTYTANPGKFHLIFMDINMPEMDGREAARIIREKGFTEVPIIAMTAHALKEDREKCREVGMNDYIAKPIKRDIVFNMVNKWVLKDQ